MTMIDIYSASGLDLDAAGHQLKINRYAGETDSALRARIEQAEKSKRSEDAAKEYFSAVESQQSAMFSVTLRDYFAAKAIQGFSSSMGEMCLEDIEKSIPVSAQLSYAIADAMLAARGESK